tara:strand:+ start:925 stop:1521 length:597 start_codon:yes stop_codon:yes gene_type:complete
MIKFISPCLDLPYLRFNQEYNNAVKFNQKNVEAIAISSYSQDFNEVNSRFVNLKFVEDKKFIFFSNYNSPKSQEFENHNQISALIFWNETNIQIRLKGMIKKTSKKYNMNYFQNRSKHKNALAISSNQSKIIDTYESVKKNYKKSLENDNLIKCPDYWGGYYFIPYYFEFWEGHISRLNKREVYEIKNKNWIKYKLEP